MSTYKKITIEEINNQQWLYWREKARKAISKYHKNPSQENKDNMHAIIKKLNSVEKLLGVEYND